MAEDLVQEALKRFLDNEDSAIQNREGYIKRTIHNLYVTGLRKQKRHRVYVMLSANSDSYTFFPSSSFEMHGELDQLFSLMQNLLTPQERVVFIMKKSFEKEYEWIEENFGIRYENCRQLLHRAKAKLKNHKSYSNYRGGSALYHLFLKASRTGDLSELIETLKSEMVKMN